MRWQAGRQLRALEQRRPRQYEGLRGEVLKDILQKRLEEYPEGSERTLLLGAPAGATLTADRACRRGLRDTPHCPPLLCGRSD